MAGPINENACAQSAFNVVDKEHMSLTPRRGYLLQTFRDPNARWSNEDRTNWAPFITLERSYSALADNYAQEGKNEEAKKTLDMMDTYIPPERVYYDNQILPYISQLYKRLGNAEKSQKYSKYAMSYLEKAYNENATSQFTSRDIGQAELYVQSLIASTELDKSQAVGQLEKAQSIVEKLLPIADRQSQGLLTYRKDQLNAMLTEKKGDIKKAIGLYEQFFEKYAAAVANSPSDFIGEFNEMRNHADALKQQIGIADTLIKKDSLKK
jgi:hypothetical protein